MSDQWRELVRKLAIPHHAPGAHRALLRNGLAALPAVREGLRHDSADVRYWCCQFLDHFLVPEAMNDLIAMLDDPDSRVRCSALHTLSCDRARKARAARKKQRFCRERSRLLQATRIRMSAPMRSAWLGDGFTPMPVSKPSSAAR